MNIEKIPPVQDTQKVKASPVPAQANPEHKMSNDTSLLTSETKRTLDKATGLMQAIVTEKMTDDVIRKMPADEYLELLSLLDDMMTGSIDQRV